MAACDRVTVTVIDASTKVIGVKAFVVRVAEPFTWALLIEVAGGRWCAAGTGLSVADLSTWTIAAVVGWITVVV